MQTVALSPSSLGVLIHSTRCPYSVDLVTNHGSLLQKQCVAYHDIDVQGIPNIPRLDVVPAIVLLDPQDNDVIDVIPGTRRICAWMNAKLIDDKGDRDESNVMQAFNERSAMYGSAP